MNLWAELKRRNVVRVAVAYLAGGWLLTEVMSVITTVYHAPDWVMQVLIALLAIGFPVALLLSWAYEITPEGVMTTSDAHGAGATTRRSSKRLAAITVSLIVIAAGVLVIERIWLSGRDAREQAVEAGLASKSVRQSFPPTSIAVLPFDDMSVGKDQEYLSDGLAEELLTLLARIPQLQVAARTSSFSFKGQQLEIPQIAQRLRVANILEGSVRKSGTRVRITAQLIKASEGYHLWSETYNRELEDIFAIQDEIAAHVVEQLKVTLLGEAPRVEVTRPEAYTLVLQARQLADQGSSDALAGAVALYQQALAIDANYAAGWSGLARTYTRQTGQGLLPFAEGYALSRGTADRALAIDPNHAAAHSILGRIALSEGFELDVAARHVSRALELAPGDPDIINEAVDLANSLGRIEDALALAQYRVARDPVSVSALNNLGLIYLNSGRPDEALATLRTALALSPGRFGLQATIGRALLAKGDPERALEAMRAEAFFGFRMLGEAQAYHALGRDAESDAILAELTAKHEREASYNFAYTFAYRGDPDRAFEWLEKAATYKDPGLTHILVHPWFSSIKGDPRWLLFLERIGRSPAQLAAIEFEVHLPTYGPES